MNTESQLEEATKRPENKAALDTESKLEPVENLPETRIAADGRLKVLFLCTGNSCRSQMAEGWARHLRSDVIEAYSAGIKRHGLNRVAVKVMMQVGVDISEHRSKKVASLGRVEFDYVVTVCDNAHETCPVFYGDAKIVHKSFDDPPRLAELAGTEDEAMGHYLRVRDEIAAFVRFMPESLYNLEKGQEPEQMSLGI